MRVYKCMWHRPCCTKMNSVRKFANARARKFYAYEISAITVVWKAAGPGYKITIVICMQECERSWSVEHHLHAFPKKMNICWSQTSVDVIKPNRHWACRSTPSSFCMLSVRNFDPKGSVSISEVRVHTGAIFGHPGCWPLATCRFSTKIWRSFDHRDERNWWIKSFEKGKTWMTSEICE